jgi:hypothetical protein
MIHLRLPASSYQARRVIAKVLAREDGELLLVDLLL